MTFSSQNRFPSSHLISGMALLFFCCVTALPTSERSLNSDSTSSSQISSQLLPEDRRSHCGLQTVKILSLLCSNDFKYQLDQMNKDSTSTDDDENLQYDLQLLKQVQQSPTNLKVSSGDKKLSELLNTSSNISDRQVQADRKYHRIKRSVIRQCCHKSCSLSELSNYCYLMERKNA